MFEKIKQRIITNAKAEAVNEIRRSSNEGRIRTASALLEGLLLLGFIVLSAKGGGGGTAAAKTVTNVIIQNSTIIIK